MHTTDDGDRSDSEVERLSKPVFTKEEAALLPAGTEDSLTEMVLHLKRMETDENYRKEVSKRIS